MNTFLGASQDLDVADVDYEKVAAAGITYLEGYLWDPERPRAAMIQAREVAKAAGKRVAFTLSDVFVVERHRQDLQALVDGRIDVLFANEAEICSLYEVDSFDEAARAVRGKLPIAVITRSEKGAVVLAGDQTVEVPAEPVEKVIDTTGAGDLFAAGFLFGLSRGRSLADCARLGAIAAAEVISHYGARPEADLKKLTAKIG
jgi:sugar/nucleoside kinase (ribokinase family)